MESGRCGEVVKAGAAGLGFERGRSVGNMTDVPERGEDRASGGNLRPCEAPRIIMNPKC